jgi:hypothetical protein
MFEELPDYVKKCDEFLNSDDLCGFYNPLIKIQNTAKCIKHLVSHIPPSQINSDFL